MKLHSTKIGPTSPLAISLLLILISWLSIKEGVPRPTSPAPLLVVIPIFMNTPFWAALFIAPFFYLVLLSSMRLTIATYILLTGLSIFYLVISWEGGTIFQGMFHTIVVTLINIIVILLLLKAWQQKHLAFFRILLVSWMFSYAFPYLGEMP